MPEHLIAPYNFEHHLDCHTRLLRTELGYAERLSRDEAMQETVEWERTHAPDQPPDQLDATRFNYAAEDAALAKLALLRR
jgi:hypothetical protein